MTNPRLPERLPNRYQGADPVSDRVIDNTLHSMLQSLHVAAVRSGATRRDTMTLDVIWSLILIGAAVLTLAGLTIG